MRKVIFGGANSLDNYFARADGSVDWLKWSDDAAKIMAEMWPRFDCMVMGRKTWANSQEQFSEEDLEQAAKMSAGMKVYVFSRSLPAGPARGGGEIVNSDAGEFVRQLKEQGAPTTPSAEAASTPPQAGGELKDIMVMGGGELARSLFEAGVIDEIGFNIHPVLLGSGIPLFHEMSRQIDLELVECKPLEHGCVYVYYKVKK